MREWKDAGDAKGVMFRAVPSEMHKQMSFLIALGVVDRFNDLVVHPQLNKDVFNLAHEAVLFMSMFPATNAVTLNSLWSTLNRGVSSKNVIQNDLKKDLTTHGGDAWGILRSYVYGFTNSATNDKLPVFPAKPTVTNFFSHAVGVASRPALSKLQESHAYRHLSGELALRLLRSFAESTTLTEEVMPPVEPEPVKDAKMEDDEEDEEEREKKEKEKKKKKKPVPEVYEVR